MSNPTTTGPFPLGRPLAREDFSDARIEQYRAFLQSQNSEYTILSAEEREASRQSFLGGLPEGQDLWVFAYGSLMWNPAFHVAETAPAHLSGYERHFCLKLVFGRATPEKPGLMLALVEGTGCWGLAHRIDAAHVDSETHILWQREMLSGAYIPHWARLTIAARPQSGLAFVSRPGHPRIETGLDEATQAARIAQAEGLIGTNRDYLRQTLETLSAHGLSDRYIQRLAQAVRSRAELPPGIQNQKETP